MEFWQPLAPQTKWFPGQPKGRCAPPLEIAAFRDLFSLLRCHDPAAAAELSLQLLDLVLLLRKLTAERRDLGIVAVAAAIT